MAEAEYKRYSDKLEEARITDNLDRQRLGNVRVIQSAVPSQDRVRPRRLLNVALAMVLGGIVSVGIAFLADHIESVFVVPERVQRELHGPILGTLTDVDAVPPRARPVREP
jgi:capsular polysaccharide biosynthesis protein